MIPEGEKEVIRKFILQNAYFHEGIPNTGSVIGKIMSEYPDFRKNPLEVKKKIEEQVKWFNSLTEREREREMGSLPSEMLERDLKRQEGLPPLRDAVRGRVVTRFAPSPTGPLSIFQVSRALMLSYLYAREYGGRFVLRIEDTDVKKIRNEYYGMIKEDLLSMGVKWDRLVMQSDHLPAYYRHAEKLIKDRRIYACFCPAERFRELKLKKQNCPCRDFSPGENLGYWEKAKEDKYKEGEVVFRLNTSMHDPNPALRDPPMLRINKGKHPRKGSKYKVWPLYNYSCAIDDHLLGITHVFRGKEHEHNTAVQMRLYEALGWKPPVVINFGMIYLPGEKLHTRDVAEMIRKKEISGWDDPRLPTVRALIRRGFTPEAFRLLSVQVGLTKHDINIDWETFYGINRKLIDSGAERYRVVTDPVGIDIGSCIKETGTGKAVSVQKHPERSDTRKVAVTPRVYISGEDFKRLAGKNIRLLDLFNVRLDKRKKCGLARSQAITGSIQKIQWVPEGGIPVTILKPDAVIEGKGEHAMKGLAKGEIIQMLRIGFGRVDNKTKTGIKIVFAHK